MKIINIANILFLFIVKAGVGNAFTKRKAEVGNSFTKRKAEVGKAFTKRKDDPMDRLILYIILIPVFVVTAFCIICCGCE